MTNAFILQPGVFPMVDVVRRCPICHDINSDPGLAQQPGRCSDTSPTPGASASKLFPDPGRRVHAIRCVLANTSLVVVHLTSLVDIQLLICTASDANSSRGGALSSLVRSARSVFLECTRDVKIVETGDRVAARR